MRGQVSPGACGAARLPLATPLGPEAAWAAGTSPQLTRPPWAQARGRRPQGCAQQEGSRAGGPRAPPAARPGQGGGRVPGPQGLSGCCAPQLSRPLPRGRAEPPGPEGEVLCPSVHALSSRDVACSPWRLPGCGSAPSPSPRSVAPGSRVVVAVWLPCPCPQCPGAGPSSPVPSVPGSSLQPPCSSPSLGTASGETVPHALGPSSFLQSQDGPPRALPRQPAEALPG